MMKKQWMFCLVQVLFTWGLYAQHSYECGTAYSEPVFSGGTGSRSSDCSRSSTDYTGYYGRYWHFFDIYTNRPEVVIPVNFNFLRDDDGTGGWQDIPWTYQKIDSVLTWINTVYNSSPYPSDPVTGIPYGSYTTTKIRFELAGIYFYNNTYLNHYSSINTSPFTSYLAANPAYQDRLKQVNIFVTDGNFSPAWGFASFITDTYQSVVTSYADGDIHPANFAWAARHLTHELAHCLDLYHTYASGGENILAANIDLLDDVFKTDICGLPPAQYCYQGGGWGCDVNLSNNDLCTDNLMSGNQDSRAISPKQMMKMHRALAFYSMRNYVKPEYYSVPYYPIQPNATYSVGSTQTWDFDIRMYNPILVKAGNTLIIKCKVQMSPGHDIMVEPGGKLIIDGGTVTSAYPETHFWKGVVLMGNNSVAQSYNPGTGMYTNHGYVVVRNGGKIEYAEAGVTTQSGVIAADGGVFSNNQVGVNMGGPYAFTQNSTFYNSVFTLDSRLPGGATCLELLKGWQNRGTVISGSTFQFVQNPGTQSSRPLGINGQDYGFTVKETCNNPLISPCPVGDINRTQFVNLLSGIRALGGMNGNTYSVNWGGFSDCNIGVESSNVNNFLVINSTFSLPEGEEDEYVIGISNSGGTAFKIEANDFSYSGPSAADAISIGVLMHNTGIAYNEVYRNTFTKLRNGIHVSGTNYNVSQWANGLKVLCNTFDQGSTDIYTLPGSTIAEYQGISIVFGGMVLGFNPAGNLFTWSPLNGSTGHFQHNGSNPVEYNHSNPTFLYNTVPSLKTSNVVNISVGVAHAACPSKLPGGGGGPGSRIDMSGTQSEYLQLAEQYKLVSLEEDTEENAVRQDELKKQMVYHAMEFFPEMNARVHDCAMSSIPGSDCLVELNELKGDLGSLLENAEVWFAQRQYTQGIAWLQEMISDHEISGNLLPEMESRISLATLLNTFLQKGNELWNLDSAQQQRLYTFAMADHRKGNVQARDILRFYYGRTFPSEISEGENSHSQVLSGNTLPKESALTVYPNPAGDVVTIDFGTVSESPVRIELLSITGQVLQSETRTGITGQYLLDISGVPAGTYMIRTVSVPAGTGSAIIIKQ